MFKALIAVCLFVPLAAFAGGEKDPGVAGVDYEILVQPDKIEVIESEQDVMKNCGFAVHGCAVLGRDRERNVVCLVFIKRRDPEKALTLRHEMRHCYGWSHEVMPRYVQSRRIDFQQRWLKQAHSNWFPLSDEHVNKLRRP